MSDGFVRKPNIVVVVSHDTGRFISPYGVETVTTPACERLATEGVLFEQCFSTAPLCSPARAALLTSRYPHQNGVMGLTAGRTGEFDLYEDERHAAEVFRDAGYESVLYGFEHETLDCTRLGFDRIVGGSGEAHNGGGNLEDFPETMDEWLASRSDSRPFYIQVGSHETHRSVDHYDAPPDDRLGLTVPDHLLDTEEVRDDVARFQGLVARWDAAIGGILDWLDRHELSGDTVFVLTTDHGIDFPMMKGTLSDDGIEALALVRYPRGGLQPGARIPDVVSHVDLLPTVCELAGIPPEPQFEGESLAPMLRGEKPSGTATRRGTAFAEKTFHDSYDPMRCVRTGRYKYVRYFEVSVMEDIRVDTVSRWGRYVKERCVRRQLDQEELYDLCRDPGERENVVQRDDYAEIAADLRRRLVEWMRATDDPLLAGPVMSPLARRKLRELVECARTTGGNDGG